jgi:two-component system, NtrC family, response regulator
MSVSSPPPIEIWTTRLRRGISVADLYYRLNVFDIHLPPLRQRREDIAELVAGFLREFDHTIGRAATVSSDAMDALLRHDWPGNVRELRNVIERASIICEDGVIRSDDLSLRATSKDVESTDLEVIERQTIERVMRDTKWNKVRASRKLGISRTQLYIRLRKYGLTDPEAASTEAAMIDNEVRSVCTGGTR